MNQKAAAMNGESESSVDEDIVRLRNWMKDKGIDKSCLARQMGIPYITVHTVVERRASTTDQFVTRFIRCYGYELAKDVFREHLSPVVVSEAT